MAIGHAEDKISLLAKHPILKTLGDRELTDLAQRARIENHSSGKIIFRKGDPGRSLMAVAHGQVKISSTSADGKEVILNIIDHGEMFGEIALLDGKERSADATAMSDVTLLVLERRDFLPYLALHPEISEKIIEVLCERLRRTSEQVEDLILVHPARVAKTLLRMAKENGRDTDDGVLIEVKLSQREFGNQVGMTREALNRQFGQWRSKGLISIKDGMIVIHDLDRFARLADAVF